MDPKPEWQGQLHSVIPNISPDVAWSLLSDFCALHKLVPSLHTCHKLSGNDRQPGCIRFCAGNINRSSDHSQPVGWSKERLTAFDEAGRSYSYEIVENNKGFGRYSATVAVVPVAGDGCRIDWSFVADPVKGWREEEFVVFFGKMVEAVAARIREEVVAVQVFD